MDFGAARVALFGILDYSILRLSPSNSNMGRTRAKETEKHQSNKCDLNTEDKHGGTESMKGKRIGGVGVHIKKCRPISSFEVGRHEIRTWAADGKTLILENDQEEQSFLLVRTASKKEKHRNNRN